MPATEESIRPAALVLAGGRGKRLGMDLPKAAVSLGGRTLLDRAVDTVARVADEIVVVAPEDLRLPDVAARRVFDPPETAGPLAGTLAGLRALRGSASTVIVFAVDFPLIPAATLQWLVASLGTARAIVPAPGGTWQPLVAVYTRNVTGVLQEQWSRGVRSITRAVRVLEPRLVGDDQLAGLRHGVAAFLNVNTPQDLLEAERLLLGVRTDP